VNNESGRMWKEAFRRISSTALASSWRKPWRMTKISADPHAFLYQAGGLMAYGRRRARVSTGGYEARACQCSESLCNNVGIPNRVMSYVFIRIIRFCIFVFYHMLSV
jgi:hypothetical protein